MVMAIQPIHEIVGELVDQAVRALAARHQFAMPA
jgi:hypothetical protein